MSIHPFAAELAEIDMGLFACAALIVVSLGAAMALIVIERVWLALRRLSKLWKGRANGR
ncbi:hypothetical protein [Stenotrophomonas maltophilia]|uniref:hypothetical protein n=1 Tax=Stenotrophomonas maltophilia TaxID=40324 RepID=UPI0013DCA730|nr:hypothetical protein [Stenotrophomonas maltophilia]